VVAATITLAPAASAATITQASPTAGTTTQFGSLTFSDQLNPQNDANGTGPDPILYTTVTSNPNLSVSPTGAVTVVGAPLAAGSYPVSGTDADTQALDEGTWTYTLTVDPLEVAPDAGTTTVAGSSAFTDSIAPTNNGGSAVTFVTTSPNASVTVSGTGGVSTSGTLAVGSYPVSGTDSDADGDTGTWSYTLTVSGGSISQAAPLTGVATTTDSSGFSAQLEPTTFGTNDVTYATTVSNAHLSVLPSGAITTVGAPLAAGPYTVSGTDGDTLGDAGTWSFTLTVSGVTFAQTAPISGSTSTGSSSAFTAQLEPTTFNGSAVVYTTTATSGDVIVSPSGAISTSGTLAANPYTVSGTDTNGLGDTGTWTYTLTVASPPPPSPTGVTLTQGAPTTGTTNTTSSASYSVGPLTVTNGKGVITFTTTAVGTGLSVSTGGAVTTTGALAVGKYTVSGTDTDPAGDTGTWTFTLTVDAPPVTVTFVANGGTGTMTPQSENGPTPLTPNTFTRTKYAFTDWNTAADGFGTSYANGATYPFTDPLTLYAQWVATSHPAPKHRVTFNANGGTGTMAAQTNSVLATLATNGFTRAHYTFNDWNTAANGSGTSYTNGGAYDFNKSITLYAQWTAKPKAPHKVQFKANGGTGTMAIEAQNTPGRLSPNQFTRSHYNFSHWNTAANGSGTTYTNDDAYSFTKSITLYAQWTAKKVVIIPAVHAVVTLSPFASKSAALSSALQAQISALAITIKANHDTKVALEGFSGDLTTANQLNETDWAASLKLAHARAQAVDNYLSQQLTVVGITNCVITTSGSTEVLSVAAASQPANQKVVADLT
jgi:outer membrane protein OmpA-like peptidoglycan-associated protein